MDFKIKKIFKIKKKDKKEEPLLDTNLIEEDKNKKKTGKKRKNKKIFIIIIVVLFMILTIAGLSYFFLKKNSTNNAISPFSSSTERLFTEEKFLRKENKNVQKPIFLRRKDKKITSLKRQSKNNHNQITIKESRSSEEKIISTNKNILNNNNKDKTDKKETVLSKNNKREALKTSQKNLKSNPTTVVLNPNLSLFKKGEEERKVDLVSSFPKTQNNNSNDNKKQISQYEMLVQNYLDRIRSQKEKENKRNRFISSLEDLLIYMVGKEISSMQNDSSIIDLANDIDWENPSYQDIERKHAILNRFDYQIQLAHKKQELIAQKNTAVTKLVETIQSLQQMNLGNGKKKNSNLEDELSNIQKLLINPIKAQTEEERKRKELRRKLEMQLRKALSISFAEKDKIWLKTGEVFQVGDTLPTGHILTEIHLKKRFFVISDNEGHLKRMYF